VSKKLEEAKPTAEPEKPEVPKKPEKRIRAAKAKFYKVEGKKLKRLGQTCPRCGPAVFMADHGNRWACGRCGYTEFKKIG
jgi:small subunit ribosomal protein S27Ae